MRVIDTFWCSFNRCSYCLPKNLKNKEKIYSNKSFIRRTRVQFIRGLVWLCFKNICGKSTNPEGLLQVNCRVTSTPTQLPDIQPQLLQVNQTCVRCNSLMSQDYQNQGEFNMVERRPLFRLKVCLLFIVFGLSFVYNISAAAP